MRTCRRVYCMRPLGGASMEEGRGGASAGQRVAITSVCPSSESAESVFNATRASAALSYSTKPYPIESALPPAVQHTTGCHAVLSRSIHDGQRIARPIGRGPAAAGFFITNALRTLPAFSNALRSAALQPTISMLLESPASFQQQKVRLVD